MTQGKGLDRTLRVIYYTIVLTTPVAKIRIIEHFITRNLNARFSTKEFYNVYEAGTPI